MTMSDRFKPGDIAWLRPRGRDYPDPLRVTRPGERRLCLDTLDPKEMGEAVLIVRPARCGDYSTYHQRNHTWHGGSRFTTLARYYSERSWLVLIGSSQWIIEDRFLNKRRYVLKSKG